MDGLTILSLIILFISSLLLLLPEEGGSPDREITRTISWGMREMEQLTADALRRFDHERRR